VIGNPGQSVTAVETAAQDFLSGLMRRYQVDRLVGTDRTAFARRLDEFLNLDDHAMEGYADPAAQRDLSVKFHWGHHHDFGEFCLVGRMRQRHLWLLGNFMEDAALGKPLPRDLRGKRVLDVGCWTGGTSLLLAAMGAQSITAIEEVRKYADCVSFLAGAFGIDERLRVRNLSLYECAAAPEFQDAFDYALFAGVLYHVTDPVLALRIVFNSLRDGGTCLLETLATDSDACDLDYQGPAVFHPAGADQPERRSRGGWNWMVPSAKAVKQMMRHAGFTDVRVTTVRFAEQTRALAVGRRQRHVDITRAGLSLRNIR
jgi:SAM-dependent methyltransferase